MEILEVKLHATYIDNLAFDVCNICHSSLYSQCINCSGNNECASILGKCGHYYHLHCIEKWKTARYGPCKCPIDKQLWIPVLNSSFTNTVPRPTIVCQSDSSGEDEPIVSRPVKKTTKKSSVTATINRKKTLRPTLTPVFRTPNYNVDDDSDIDSSEEIMEIKNNAIIGNDSDNDSSEEIIEIVPSISVIADPTVLSDSDDSSEEIIEIIPNINETPIVNTPMPEDEWLALTNSPSVITSPGVITYQMLEANPNILAENGHNIEVVANESNGEVVTDESDNEEPSGVTSPLSYNDMARDSRDRQFTYKCMILKNTYNRLEHTLSRFVEIYMADFSELFIVLLQNNDRIVTNSYNTLIKNKITYMLDNWETITSSASSIARDSLRQFHDALLEFD